MRKTMDFNERLDRAIQRGQQAGNARARADAQRAMTEKELQRLHSQYRLEVCEHIERCLNQLADRFPGFRFETIVDSRGWGAVVSREDLRLRPGQSRRDCFSRLELVVSPISPAFVLEMTAKGTVCNREVYRRTHYQPLAEFDTTTFTETIDLWVLEYAERYASQV